MSRIKSITLNLMLAIGSLAVTLLVLEAGARILLPAAKARMTIKKVSPADAERPIEWLNPSFEASFAGGEYRSEIKTNSLGFRDVEHALNKTPDTFRILIAGDSFTFGIGVEADETYPKVLESILNEGRGQKALRYEVFNLGVIGIGTREEYEILKYAIRYDPDLILLGVLAENRWNDNGNDLYDNFKSSRKARDEKIVKNSSAGFPLRAKTRLVNCLNSLQSFLNKNSEFYFFIKTKKGMALRQKLVRLREGRNRAELETGWDITKDALKKINALAQETNTPFALIRIPFFYDVYSDNEDRASEILAEFGRENKINVLGLLASLRNNKNKDLYYPADGHWKAEAHSLAAGEIFNYLVDKNLIQTE